MVKEKFLIVAIGMPVDCFGHFSETDNCAAIDRGEPIKGPYGWIEGAFEIVLVRDKEATHICSFTPSAYGVWLANEFVGKPNAAWEANPDPEGLEHESGQDSIGDYYRYHDEWDARFVCETFTVDTMHDLDRPMRKRTFRNMPSRRSDAELAYVEKYHDAIWSHAIDAAHDLMANGVGQGAPILGVYAFRQWQKELRERRRQHAPHGVAGVL